MKKCLDCTHSDGMRRPTMRKSWRSCSIWLLILVSILFAIGSTAYGKGYKGFQLLNPDHCVALDKKIVLQLPAEWHKYGDFVKICGLKQEKSQTAKISIISIWVQDYFGTLASNAAWEKFPLPLIVDEGYRQAGHLPELYPMDQPRELDVYVGKWQSGVPTEIRVDVYNPAVTGDYYYAPLVWSKKNEAYEMRSGKKERTYGHRPK
jgi:hypothetical protein